MKNFLNGIRYLPKTAAIYLAVLLVIAAPVVVSAAVDTTIEGDIRVKNVTSGTTLYTESTKASANDVVRFKVWYHNTELPSSNKVAENLSVKIGFPTQAGDSQDVAVTIKGDNTNTVYDSATVYFNSTKAHLEYIPGSAKWQHNVGTRTNIQYSFTGLSDSIVTDGAFVRLENEQPCFEYEAWVYFDAKVVVDEQPQPVYSCDALSVITVDSNTRKLKASATAKNGATVLSYAFNFGDGKSETVTTNALTATTKSHDYAPGTYTAVAKVNFDVNGDSKTDVSKSCTAKLTVEKPPVTPPKKELPNTGIEGVLTGFFGTGALGLGVRSWFDSRRAVRGSLLRNKKG